jgi:hypothetical protein
MPDRERPSIGADVVEAAGEAIIAAEEAEHDPMSTFAIEAAIRVALDKLGLRERYRCAWDTGAANCSSLEEAREFAAHDPQRRIEVSLVSDWRQVDVEPAACAVCGDEKILIEPDGSKAQPCYACQPAGKACGPMPVSRVDTEPAECVTHGRHCICSACAAQDWAEPALAPCGMHGPSCAPAYAPLGAAGDVVRRPSTTSEPGAEKPSDAMRGLNRIVDRIEAGEIEKAVLMRGGRMVAVIRPLATSEGEWP